MLESSYDTEEAIPEAHRELYSKRGDRWELTGVRGVKTQADVARVQSALDLEKKQHKETRDKLRGWSDLGELGDVQSRLDRIPELEAAADGKLDDDAINEIVDRRVEGRLKSQLAPIERERDTAKRENEELKAERDGLAEWKSGRQLREAIEPHIANVLPEHREDALDLAQRSFERVEIDGRADFVVREGVVINGTQITAGLNPKLWAEEIAGLKPGYYPPSEGAGARGSQRGVPGGGANPFSADGWNLTKQGQVLREHGADKANALAAAAGTTVGGPRPEKK